MPAPACTLKGSVTCCFSGRAAKITLQGEGVAVFAEGEPLSDGRAAQVDLIGASIEGGKPGLTLLQPAALEPLPMSGAEQVYGVTYTEGSATGPIIIELDLPAPAQGQAASTSFFGVLAEAPGCAREACTITWPGQIKTVQLRRAVEATMNLTGAFPGDRGKLHKVLLEGARGTLRCKEEGGIREQAIDGGPLLWLGRNDGALFADPLQITGHALGVAVESSEPPRPTTREAPNIPMALPETPVVITAGMLLRLSAIPLILISALVAAVILTRKVRRRAAPEPTPDWRVSVLLVFANPRGTDPLQLGAEERALRESIKLSAHRDRFDIEALHAATVDDLRRALRARPRTIVHFSGRGEEGGLQFEDEGGQLFTPDVAELGDLLRRRGVETVVLNACYGLAAIGSAPMANRYTITMEGKVSDQGAVEFARGFYDELGAGSSVEEAYEEGRSCAAVKKVKVSAVLIAA